MPEMTVVMTSKGELRGFTPEDDASYQRFKKWLKALGAGEFFMLTYRKPRNYRFHKKLFAMLNLAFEHWNPAASRKRLTYKGVAIEKDFEQFREDITIQAGFYVAKYDSRGRVHLKAKSIAFDSMEEEEFERLYNAVRQVLLERVLKNYTPGDLDRVVEELQRF
jgi:hypothetical protein